MPPLTLCHRKYPSKLNGSLAPAPVIALLVLRPTRVLSIPSALGPPGLGVSLISLALLGLTLPASATALAGCTSVSAFFYHPQPERSPQGANYVIILLYKIAIPWPATALMQHPPAGAFMGS